jgi:hypothetical protein
MKAKKCKKKGQTAMEYLMTYGWAILIVIIVAAALYALGVFNPATYAGSRATGFANLGAPRTGAWKLTAGGEFNLRLKNNLDSRIKITPSPQNITITIGTTTCATITQPSEETTYAPGEEITITATGCGSYTSGSSYTANIRITYDNVDTGITDFKETGTVTGTVS